jgi:hypothetical protein
MSKFINEEITMAIGSGFIKPELLTTGVTRTSVAITKNKIIGRGVALRGKSWEKETFEGLIKNVSSIGVMSRTNLELLKILGLPSMISLGLVFVGSATAGLFMLIGSIVVTAILMALFGKTKILKINCQGIEYPLIADGISDTDISNFITEVNKVKEMLLAQESSLPHSHESDSGDAKDRLVKLKELLSEGFITESEYEEKRKAILGQI